MDSATVRAPHCDRCTFSEEAMEWDRCDTDAIIFVGIEGVLTGDPNREGRKLKYAHKLGTNFMATSSWELSHCLAAASCFEESAGKNLADLVKRVDAAGHSAKIVFTTWWLQTIPFADLREKIFSRSPFRDRIVGGIATLKDPEVEVGNQIHFHNRPKQNREEAIASWLQQHGLSACNYVVVENFRDKNQKISEAFSERVVKVGEDGALGSEQVERTLQVIQPQGFPDCVIA